MKSTESLKLWGKIFAETFIRDYRQLKHDWKQENRLIDDSEDKWAAWRICFIEPMRDIMNDIKCNCKKCSACLTRIFTEYFGAERGKDQGVNDKVSD